MSGRTVGAGGVVDAFEIGLALAAPGGMQAGLAVMVEMLAALDEAAAAGWVNALDADRGAVKPGPGVAPETMVPSPAMEGETAADWRDGTSLPSAAVISDPAGAPREGGARVAGGASGDRESQAGPYEASISERHEHAGLRPRRGVHLKLGHGLARREAMHAAPEPDVRAVGRNGGAGVRRALNPVEQLREGVGGSASAAGDAVQEVGADWGSVAVGLGGSDSPAVGGAARAAVSAGLVSDVAAVRRVVPGGVLPPGRVGARSRSALGTGGYGGGRGAAPGYVPLGPAESQAAAAGAAGPVTQDGAERGGGGLLSSRAAAPGQEDGGSSPGATASLELDGRVIGQWLAERMARDASRPGSGTTFFDPRQAPAWSPSGSL